MAASVEVRRPLEGKPRPTSAAGFHRSLERTSLRSKCRFARPPWSSAPRETSTSQSKTRASSVAAGGWPRRLEAAAGRQPGPSSSIVPGTGQFDTVESISGSAKDHAAVETRLGLIPSTIDQHQPRHAGQVPEVRRVPRQFEGHLEGHVLLEGVRIEHRTTNAAGLHDDQVGHRGAVPCVHVVRDRHRGNGAIVGEVELDGGQVAESVLLLQIDADAVGRTGMQDRASIVVEAEGI